MLEALTELVNWFSEGIYDFFVNLMAYLTIWITYGATKLIIFLIGFFWDVGNQMFAILEIQSMIDNFINNLDNEAIKLVAYLRGFDALVIILNAKITRYILSIMGI